MNTFRKGFVLAMILLGFWGGKTASAAEASLYLSPTSGTFAVGDTFTVSVYVNTGGQSINAVEADLSFPPDKLQVASPSSGRSFISTWVSQPIYSNSAGTLHFAGAVPAPGIATSAGLVSTITFRVVNTGTAVIKLLDASRVLLNDGKGTDVLSQTTNGIYALTVPPPAGPIVTSPTNPDQGKWYKTAAVVLRWSNFPSNVEGYSYVLNDSPVDMPDNIPEGPGTFVAYNNISDGVHYFHIKAMQGGLWGGVTNYAVRVDNTPPAAFQIDISPGDYTSDQTPVVQFQTTDAASGIDHYEMKVIPLNPSLAEAAGNNASFFTEAASPYMQRLNLGSYDVVVRAYDTAGNFYQTTKRLAIVSPLFEMAGKDGLRVDDLSTLGWPYVIVISALLVAALGFALKKIRRLHRDIENRLLKGAATHPEIAQKLQELKQKRKECEEALKRLAAIMLFFGAAWWGFSGKSASAAGLALNPPIINLFPASLANDEVLYLGGWANVPNAQVEIYIEQAETGNTFSGTATTGADGNWFYSFPQLLDSGHYAAWAELKNGDAMSPPSARVNVTVAPAAIRIGNARLDYAELYFFLFLFFLALAVVFLALIFFHARQARAKRTKLEEMVRDAEESLRRGFSVLQRDIEFELAAVRKLKLTDAFREEERLREEKLVKDLDDVKRYVGKEIWRIEEEEKKP